MVTRPVGILRQRVVKEPEKPAVTSCTKLPRIQAPNTKPRIFVDLPRYRPCISFTSVMAGLDENGVIGGTPGRGLDESRHLSKRTTPTSPPASKSRHPSHSTQSSGRKKSSSKSKKGCYSFINIELFTFIFIVLLMGCTLIYMI